MATVRKLRVLKKPLEQEVADVPIEFGDLTDLHLDLMEVKSKLKSGLPLIPIAKPKMKSPQQAQPVHPLKKEKPSAGVKPTIEIPTISDSDKPASSNADKSNKPVTSKPVPGKTEKKIQSEEEDSEENESEEESTDFSAAESEEENETAPEKVVEDDPYAGMSPEEREVVEKEEYIWRFRILKKQYGRSSPITIPEYNEHSDLPMMKKSYERVIRELYLEDNVESYRTILMGSWVIIEYFAIKYVGIDMDGFVDQQTRSMYKYDRLLIELGEKSYSRWGSSLPVEIRLLGLVLVQAGLFYIAKVVEQEKGSFAADAFRSFTGQPSPQQKGGASPNVNSSSADVPPQQRKMRGPSTRVGKKPEDAS